MDAARHFTQFMLAMCDCQNTALTEHHIVIQILSHAFPQFKRMFIDRR